MRTVDLPMMTPTRTRSREDPDPVRRPSLPGRVIERLDNGALLQFDEPEQGQLSGTTAVEDGAAVDDKSIDGVDPNDISEIDGMLDVEEDVMEARVNRKVCPMTFSEL
jgi:hypothetical protein